MITNRLPYVEWVREADADLHHSVHSVVSAVVDQQGAVGWLQTPTADETAQWLDGELAAVRGDAAHVAIASLDGSVCGLAILSLFQPAVFRRNGHVRKVMTHPRVRGRGVARAVLIAIAGKARELQLENLILDVRGNNHGAMSLYESLGWVRCGVLPDFIAIGADRFDQVKYVLALDKPAGVVLHGQRCEGPGASTRRP